MLNNTSKRAPFEENREDLWLRQSNSMLKSASKVGSLSLKRNCFLESSNNSNRGGLFPHLLDN
jgi:hypothetical protein